MGTREEEYLRRMKALGYEPSLTGMDDEDIEWELNKMEEAERRREAPQPARTVYRPVDPGLQARILRQFGQPYDKSAISPKQSFYLNGWDDGEEDGEGYGDGGGGDGGSEVKLPDFTPRQDGPIRPAFQYDDSWAKAWRPDWGPGGNPLRTMEGRPRGGTMFPSRGGAVRPLSYKAGGGDTGAGVQPTSGSVAGNGTDSGSLSEPRLQMYQGPNPPDMRLQDTFPSNLKPVSGVTFSYVDKDGNQVAKKWTISDEEFQNSKALNQEQITAICNKENPELVKRGFDSAIYQYSQKAGINPKVLLATLAQEQGWCRNGGYDKAWGVWSWRGAGVFRRRWVSRVC